MEKVIMKDPKKKDYFYEEAIKTLRANIQFSGRNMKVILFTSCYPNEGKSDIIFQLSREMGKTGKRVLLLDADIRRSSYVARYKINQNIQGLSQYLSGQTERYKIYYSTNFENMDIILSGPSAPNPSELLEEQAFDELLTEARAYYDYILIDTPPIGSVIDAAVIGKKSDGAILVVESELVSYRLAQKVQNQLKKSGCKILGAVLNKVDTGKSKYYGKYKICY